MEEPHPLKSSLITALPLAGAIAASVALPAAANVPATPSSETTQIVSGTLHPQTFEDALNAAWSQKIAAEQAAAAEAARVAAEQAAAAEAARVAAQQAAAAEAARVAAQQAIEAAVVANWQAQAAAATEEAVAAAVVNNWQAQAAADAPTPATGGSQPATQNTYTPPAAPAASANAAASEGGASGDVSAWANSAKSMSVKMCESGNNYSTNTGNGYYGAWQFDYPSWHANGGGAYAEYPHQAPSWAQDQVAYNYYQKAGWGPWACG